MERQWTSAQRSAIEASGRDLLVSAGAGSGKTAVLTERIIRRLTDTENPADISRMLVVTFTKAAAGELKERISAAIETALAKNPEDRRLARELLKLDRAKICTIHSFCLDLLREGIGDVGIREDFRIADDAEITLLRKSIMDEVIEDYYSDAVTEHPIENFAAFADAFVGTKSDDKLADIFLDIENHLSSFTEHIEFIKNFADELRSDTESGRDFGLTRCGAELLDLVRGRMTEHRDFFADMLTEFADDEKMAKAYLPAFSADVAFMDAVRKTERYDEMRRLVNDFAPVRLGIIRNAVFSEDVERAKELRKAFSAERKKLTEKFFSLTHEEIREVSLDTADMLRKLYTVLHVFLTRFTAEKRRRSIVDFGDLERIAYDLLITDGTPNEVAATVARRFDEIYIDEYQDVNSVQDAIFAAVSSGKNRFMVGDIKQSIYAFRGAEPRIFSDYRRTFGRLDDENAPEDQGAAIFLSDNFRCDSPVIDFANLVSGCLFTGGRGDIPFYPEDLLVHAKQGEESGEPVHVVLISGESAEDDDKDAISAREAEYVASEIARLLREGKKDDGTPIRASDIAILMRGAKAHSKEFEDAFTKFGIPLYSSADGDFFENAEVLLALCILNVIDNPTRDIYLAGALRGPVFGFTLDDLIKIRRTSPDGCLYDALRTYCETHDFEKGKRFLDDLARWREKSLGLPIDRLLWYIYTDTDLLALVFEGDETRRANLMLLYEYARRFESSSFKGLYNFIRYVNDILEEKATLKNAKILSESADTVRLMTIHESKGLEFPVCFICGAGRKFNESDLRQNIVIERSLGIALKLSDVTGFARYDTPIRQAIVKCLADSQLEEEMRLLYVAMTRAREKLYVTALVKDTEKLLDETEMEAKHLTKYAILKNGGYMRWILLALFHARQTGDTRPYVIETVGETNVIEPIESANASTPEELPITNDLRALVAERFDFTYPNIGAAKLPAKLSVSKLYPTVLDDEESDALTLEAKTEPYSFTAKTPLFLEETTHERSPSGAERGTATHLFMQFCDFTKFKGEHTESALLAIVREEAARLTEDRFITPRSASLIEAERIAAFFRSETFREICASPRVWREHRFNVKLPAADFTADHALKAELADETILVQGVIDCFYENPDGTLTILDYKTDHIPRGMSEDEAQKMLIERHGLQLSYYKTACERIAARRVSRVELWSFGLGRKIVFDV